ncbi:SH2 domain-containing protein 1B [Phascolarctos cinereus]|uniref:SH2 domain-containing protein 1B n=1 Tax=Phascolarctos cinereus TaxID=38626 RepID=A0A6P5KFD5_PHACI|nr:SH2 domain-containing protein 1B [Phascolarctos cinereus]
MDLPYYHGPLTKKACETLLLQERKDGKFLLRDSESVPGALCLCVLFQNKIYTYRIKTEKYGYYTIQTAESGKKVLFPNLKELISKFEKPNQGLVIPLRYPVEKNNVYQSQRNPPALTALDDDDYVNVNNDDYVEVIP